MVKRVTPSAVACATGSPLAPLMHLQLRVLEKVQFEKRLGRLERLMREGIMEYRKGRAAEECQERVEPRLDRNHKDIQTNLHVFPSPLHRNCARKARTHLNFECKIGRRKTSGICWGSR
jgi:hypothetical protein